MTTNISTNEIEFCSIYIEKLLNKEKLDFDVKKTRWQRYYISRSRGTSARGRMAQVLLCTAKYSTEHMLHVLNVCGS